MKKEYAISFYLDSRRKKSNGKYPLKLSVYMPFTQKKKMYPTAFEFTPNEFDNVWGTTDPRGENKQTKLQLQKIENQANDIASDIDPFSFERFERKIFRKAGDGLNVAYQYQQAIDRFRENKQIGTAVNYEVSLKSLLDYFRYSTRRESGKLLLSDITPAWLDKYENFMVNVKGRSRTTVSIYVRTLRTVFNNAIADKEIDRELYPFGKRKYQVPASTSVKKALSKEELKKLFEAKPRTAEQEKAKDFWFFSYICNGMNIKDIAYLRYENLSNDSLNFYRAKTAITGKGNQKPVTVILTDFAKTIIEKYGNKNKSSKNLIFTIISDGQTDNEKHWQIKNFTRFINQNLKKLSVTEGITGDISTYWARHSFATTAIRNGASMEFVSEALNHSDLKTTKGYFAGFEDIAKKEIMESLLNF